MGGQDPFADEVELYALGALTADERRDFEAHLAVCAQCAADVRAYAPIVAGLAAARAAEPSPRVRTALMTGIRADRPKPAAAWLPLAAAVLLAVGLGGYAAQLRTRMSALESERAVLVAPDLARVDLAGQAAAPAATGRAFWSRSRGLVFTASNLPPLPAGRTYQLWVLTSQPAPVSAGLLKPDANGRASAVFATPSDLPKPMAMAVTLEPDGGVPSPTGDKFLVGLAN